MAKSIERYFSTMSGGKGAQLAGRLWRPAADVYRTAGGWVVKIDLAGVCADELEIVIEAETLRVAGCRRDTLSIVEGITYQQLEITYSRFERTLRFPCSIEGATVVRDYRDGLLILHLRSNTGENCDEGK